MDISMVTAPTANSAAPAATAGNPQVVTSSGNVDASTGGDSFVQVLGGQFAQDTVNQPTDAAMTLAGLLQLLPSLMLPIQNVVQSQTEGGEAAKGLPDMLLQGMNGNDALADKLLQDPNVAQWFQQAQAILGALTGKDAAPVSAANPLNSALTVNNNLQAQNTLLALSSMLNEQPDNVVLQHIVQDLQKVVQPLLPQLAADMNQASADLNLAIQGTSSNATQNQATANGLIGQPAPVKTSTTHAANKHDAVKHSSKLELESSDAVIVQPVKSQLELLAAKTAVNAPVFTAPAGPEAEVELTPQLQVEPAANNSPIIQLTDMAKTPLHTETAVKAAAQMIHTANFAQDMSEHMLKNMKITLADGISEAKISLFPKNLGHVDVKITMHEGQLIAYFAADTLAGKQMLESQLPQLRQTLQSQGLQVEKLEVTQSQNMQSGMFQDQRHGQQANQNLRQNKGKSVANYDLDNVEFVQQLSATEQAKSTVYGNSFDVTA